MPITPLPAAPSIADPLNFAATSDSFIAALPQFAAEVNAMYGSVAPDGYTVQVFDFMTTPQIADVQSGSPVLDCSAILVTASASGAYLEFPAGTYLLSTDCSPASMRWFSRGGAIIRFANETVDLVADGIAVDVKGIIFEGNLTTAQYTTGIASTGIVTAFGTPTYLDNTDTPFAGADFTHTLVSNTLTLGLAALAGANKRSILSDYITLVPGDRYVFHVDTGCLSASGNYSGITIYKYDAAHVLLGEYDPAASTSALYLSGATYIKIKLGVQRNTNTKAENGTTTLDLSKMKILKLANNANTFAPDSKYDSATYLMVGTCVAPVIRNCTFRYMSNKPVTFANCVGGIFQGNHVRQSYAGMSVIGSTNFTIQGNVFDIRQLHTDGTYYFLKFLRFRGVGGHTSQNTVVVGNTIVGANWAIEIAEPDSIGRQVVISGNNIYAEICGISLGHGAESVVSDNRIQVASGWPRYGIEIPGVQTNINCTNNAIKFYDSLNPIGYGISCSMYVGWVGGRIHGNKLECPLGVFINPNTADEKLSSISITGNTFDFSIQGLYIARIGAEVVGNVFRKKGSLYLSYLKGTDMYTAFSSMPLTILGNTFEAGDEGFLEVNHTYAIVKGNVLNAPTGITMPVAVLVSSNSGFHNFQENIFTGSVPTAYYTGSGSSERRSSGNRDKSGNVILLGHASYVDVLQLAGIATTGVGANGTHTIYSAAPGNGTRSASYLIDVKVEVTNSTDHLLMGTFLLRHSNSGAAHKAGGGAVPALGATVVSVGSAVVLSASATLTMNYTDTNGLLTITAVQGTGIGAGASATTYIKMTKLGTDL